LPLVILVFKVENKIKSYLIFIFRFLVLKNEYSNIKMSKILKIINLINIIFNAIL